MSDFETRARAAADALGSDDAAGDPTVVHKRLRRRRAVRALASSAVVVVAIGAFAVARRDGPLRIGTTNSTAGTTSSTLEDTTTSSSSTVPTTTTTVPNLPDAVEAPNVIVGVDSRFVTIRSGENQVEQRVSVTFADNAYRMRDGSLIGQVTDGQPEAPTQVTGIWRFPPGGAGARIPELDNYRLLGAGVVGGDDVVFLSPPYSTGFLGVERPAVVVYDVRTGSMRSIGSASGGNEGSTGRVTIAGDVLLVFGGDGQSTTTVKYYNAVTGNRITGRPMPTSPSEQPSGPMEVVISPDGTRVVYLDTPTAADSNGPISKKPTDLVIIDARSGAELQRVTLTPTTDWYGWLEFDGRWAIASRWAYKSRGDWPDLPAVVVDTQAANPTPAQIPGAVGTTTFDSAP